jgi:uncharacterized membrane protein
VTTSGLASWVGTVVASAGVIVILVSTCVALVRFAAEVVHPPRTDGSWSVVRERIGRGVLLGLEVLVAGDIVRTVAVDPTGRSVGLLAGIVVIRTFLVVTIETEVNGRWPWRRSAVPRDRTSRDSRSAMTVS